MRVCNIQEWALSDPQAQTVHEYSHTITGQEVCQNVSGRRNVRDVKTNLLAEPQHRVGVAGAEILAARQLGFQQLGDVVGFRVVVLQGRNSVP
jgi:hypothetical protein